MVTGIAADQQEVAAAKSQRLSPPSRSPRAWGRGSGSQVVPPRRRLGYPEDDVEVFFEALDQLQAEALDDDILVRSDSAGANHALADACRERAAAFSFGWRSASASAPRSWGSQTVLGSRRSTQAGALRGSLGGEADRSGFARGLA